MNKIKTEREVVFKKLVLFQTAKYRKTEFTWWKKQTVTSSEFISPSDGG